VALKTESRGKIKALRENSQHDWEIRKLSNLALKTESRAAN
jgi:hypothetical protein